MTACKKLKRGKNITIEDLYQNKNFVPPKEQNLETIFEEPKQAKDGATILTSIRKYKRYLDFDPITGKVQKPKKKGKRFVKKIKGKTRSASKTLQNIDISAVLETLNDSSDECDMDMTITASECGDGDHMSKDRTSLLPIEDINKTINANDHKATMSVLPIDDKTINDNDHMPKNSVSLHPIADKSINDDNDHMAKNSRLLSANKTVNGDHVTIKNVTELPIEVEDLNNEVLCKKCSLVENLCSCEYVSSEQNGTETGSSVKPCVVT